MSGIALAFGSYTFPAGWTITKDQDMRTVPMSAIPRRDGEAWQTATRKARRFTLEGGIYLNALPAGCATVRDGIDQLKAALYNGPQNFQIESDRFFRDAQVDGAPATHGPAYGSYAEINLNILCPDPYEYSTTQSITPELTSLGAFTLALGNADAQPAWYLYASQPLNSAFTWTWTNSTTGEIMSLSGAWPISGAGYLIADSLNDTVMSAPSLGGSPGPADAGAQTDAYSLFEQTMPRLKQGLNNLALTATDSSATHEVWATFNARFD